MSIRVGPLRFNLSKSGFGVSAGIKGFRAGTGPRGNYVHMGLGGIYYRATIPSSSPTNSTAASPRFPSPATDEERLGQMKRVLYDAVARHQILKFTCHPDTSKDLGVIAKSIS